MKTSKVIMTVAALAMCSMFQASAQQGTTHSHPISDAATEKYLTEYLGINKYSVTSGVIIQTTTTGWGFTGTKKNNKYNATEPTATTTGDVIFIEVNDYWKGTNWDNTPSLYNQVKYGVKSISKVTQSTEIGNGTLYHFDATTNRFFFAIRTSSIYDKYRSWNSANDNVYYMSETYEMPFRWYNEFSTCSNSSAKWDDLNESYDDLKDGDFQNAPHSCSNSLEKNHFTTLYDKTTTDQTYTISAMLFVPSGTNATTNKKNDSYSSSYIPQVFFYVNKLQGERVEASTNSKFAINLTWETSFDKAKSSSATFTPWSNKKGGVKEESHVYRKIEGSDEFVEVYVEDGLVDLKNWTDNTLPKPKNATGYDVTYYVVTKAVTYNAKGERTGEEIASAVTNQVTFHIPGTEQFFELSLSNIFDSKYTPVADNIRNSYNLIKNDISSKATNYSPELSDLAAGDKFELNREEEGKGTTAVNTLVITAIKNGTYSYTLNGVAGSAKWTSIQNVLDLVASYKDEVKSIPGNLYDARYQLVYTNSTNEYCSNVVSAQGKRTDVQVVKIYRSGTPDPVKNAYEELYTVDVRFKPIMSDDIAHYYIWRNAEERVVRVGQAGTSFTLVGKDEDGNFNVDMGSIEPDEDGYITLHVDYSLSKHVCDYEQGQGTALNENDLFFTVEVCTTGNNSYGNNDKATDFNGEASELVVNSYGMFYMGDDSRKGQYCAEISWDKIKNEGNLAEDDYVAGEPDYYTVHRWSTTGSSQADFVPITKFFRGHNDRYDASGNLIEKGNYELVDQTTDGTPYKFTPALIEQVLKETGDDNFYVVDFITDKQFVPTNYNNFPAIYYVKAHFETPFIHNTEGWITDENDQYPIQNYVEKNSNPTRATTLIVTGVEEKVESSIVSTTYYSIMGYPVAKPAKGQVVIAQRKHADGSTSAKVVKM